MAKKKETKPKPKTGAERQRAYHEKMRDAGFQRLAVWVPAVDKEAFDRAVTRLQKKWDKDNLYPS